jgi:phage shock protein PspC (stress-responsive transcriptional regulator)
VDWLLLAVLGIIWCGFLMPTGRRRGPTQSIDEFERRMELLANAEVNGTTGRWIVTPRKGVRFLGPQERQRARARERRRQVFVGMLEGIGLTLLIGAAPPLRVVWYVSAALGSLLVVYVWLLLTMKAHEARPQDQVRAVHAPARPALAPTPRYVADRAQSRSRPTFNGLGSIGEGDRVHVVVHPATVGAGA